ncbi:DUF6264 family protein [Agromyces sp. NPDC057865]|uniref:DUF6264 family protein n=1 Tax=Agromyces sp. NPDC057865 TaxID=3346267 RepID=UPI0036707494
MPQDEAARPTNPPSDEGRPVDPRPRPRYGEYAPEGWSWQPPREAASAESPPSAPATPAAAPTPATIAGTGAHAHPLDRGWTIALLAFGVLGVIYNVLSLLTMPDAALSSAQLTAGLLGTEPPTSFTPGPIVPVAIGIGAILQVTLWIGALLWSRARMRAGRLAWWVPVVAGVVAFAVVMVVGLIVFASDPTFFEFMRRSSAQ